MAGRRRGHCTWCGAPAPPPRRSWCSDACVAAYDLLTNPRSYRAFVFDRAGGRCEICRVDLARWERLVARWRGLCGPVHWGPIPRAIPGRRRVLVHGREIGRRLAPTVVWVVESEASVARRTECAQRLARVLRLYGLLPTVTIWQADHVVPLADGGAHALDNLRLLCVSCHKERSASQASARAGRPREG